MKDFPAVITKFFRYLSGRGNKNYLRPEELSMSSLKIKKPLLFILPILILTSILFADNVSQSSLTDIYIINSRSDRVNAAKSGSIKILEHNQIEDWANARGLEVIPDRGPLVDNSALYFVDFRGVFSVGPLRKDQHYTLRIDFVKFRSGSTTLSGYVKLYIRDKKGVEHFLMRLDNKELFKEKIFETSIPFRFSYDGDFELILYEYAEVAGIWGIWDIIIYPEGMEIDLIKEIEPEKSDESLKHNLKIFY